ncbi:MAG: TolC family protein [Nitrospirae bacterium]|nr:TolC family protein [Nitrospirota bacterium]
MDIALKKQPGISAALNTVTANQSRVGSANADYYPQIDIASGYSRASSSGSSNNQYTSSLSLKQNIYNFGKTSTQVDIERLNLDSSRADLEGVREQVIFNVKQSYYGVLRAKRNRDVAEDAVKQFNLHLEQAKGFYEVGTKPKFDVTRAEVDLGNARLDLIKAGNGLRIANASLNNVMGVPDAPEYSIEDNLEFRKYTITFEETIGRAYKNRPDLVSVVFKRQAAENSIELAKKDYYPALTGSASYSRSGETFLRDGGWDIGMTLSFPIFSGFQTKYQVEESTANLNVFKANEESLKQNIFLEIQQAYLNLSEAEERIPIAELVVRQAEENLDLANGRYTAGVGSPIEVTDAQVALNNAKLSYIEAIYDYRIAIASLEKAMGEK